MTDILIERRFHAELHYRVLSHVPLGRDAASLFRSSRPEKTWAGRLSRAYARAPGSLVLQVLPLWFEDLASMLRALEEGRVKQLGDVRGRRLTKLVIRALEEEEPPARAEWKADERAASRRTLEADDSIIGPLGRLRRLLWEGARPPPLRVLDCPSLRDGSFSHGRASRLHGSHLVAVALGVPSTNAFLQILHEEIHPVTDPLVRAAFGDAAFDTREGSAGRRLHHAVERRAVEAGAELLRAHMPGALAPYRDWCRRFPGMPRVAIEEE